MAIGDFRAVLGGNRFLFKLVLIFALSTPLFFVCDIVIYVDSGKLMVHLLDDHMITQRVAWNFYRTGLPYFNIGEKVAANTSLFWPIIISTLYNFYGYYISVAAVSLLGFLLLSLSALASIFADGSIYRSSLKAFLILASPGAIVYGFSGWEHLPQAFFVTCGLSLFLCQNIDVDRFEGLRVSRWAFSLVSVSFIFRPDSAAIILAFGFVFLLTGGFRKKKNCVLAVFLLLLPILYVLLMLYFYGDYKPNTAALKVLPLSDSFVGGILYLLTPYSSGLPFYLTVFSMLMWKKLRASERAVLGMVFSHFLYVVLVGGDVFRAGRLVLVVLPISAVVFSNVFYRLSPVRQRLGLALLVVMSSLLLFQAFREANGVGDDGLGAIESQMVISEVISQKIDPSEGSIGLHWLGVGYHLKDYHIVDFLGKADKYIANTTAKTGGPIGHNKWDYEYSLEKYNVVAIMIPHYIYLREVSYGDWEGVEFGFWDNLKYVLDRSDEYLYIPPKKISNIDISYGLYVKSEFKDRFM